MKLKSLFAVMTALALTGIAHGAASTNSGPDTLHYVARVDVRDGASNILGSAKIDYNDSGRGVLQKFDLTPAVLGKLTTFSLIAVVGADPTPVIVSTFTTDKKGKAKISYIDLPNGGGSGGATNRVLPPLLNPLKSIQGIGLADGLGNTLAFASLNTPAEFALSTKRNLTRVNPASTEAGSIDLKASAIGANFKLKADGLAQNGVYHFALNDLVVFTMQADSKGRLQILGWPFGAPPVASLHLMELRDASDLPVLSTTFGE